MIIGSFPINRNNDGVDNVPATTKTPLSYLSLIGAGSYDATVVRRWATKANSANITVPLDLELGLLFMGGIRGEQGWIINFKRILEMPRGQYGKVAKVDARHPILYLAVDNKIYLGLDDDNKLLYAVDVVTVDADPLTLYRLPLHFAV